MSANANPLGPVGAGGSVSAGNGAAEPPMPDMPDAGAVDPAIALLARAEARAILVSVGEGSAEDAVADLFPPCACDDERVKRWEQEYPHTPPKQQERRTMQAPDATINAAEHELRSAGVAALATPSCKSHLTQLSSDQVVELIARLNRKRSMYPAITDELIQRFTEAAK